MAVDCGVNYLDIDSQCLNYNIQTASSCLSDAGGNLSILNINIRSLVKNYDNLLIFLDRIGHEFDFIVITES